jgi:hypothetical protein
VLNLDNAMDMVGHDFKRKKFYLMPARSLPDAGCYQISILLFSHHLVPAFRAPLEMPRVLANAMASANQINLHKITFLFFAESVKDSENAKMPKHLKH